MIDIIPTTVPQDRSALDEAARIVSRFSTRIHVDIDDGLFTSQMTWPFSAPGTYDVSALSLPEGIMIHAHLMVREPRQLGIDLIRAGARSVIGHIESCESVADAQNMLTSWRAAGASEVGLAILVDTPLRDIEQALPFCDVVQVMSVATIGAQGAPFDPRAIERVRELHKGHPKTVISVDGGVNTSTIVEVVQAGASRLCIGSAIMQAPDPAAAYHQLKHAA